MNYEDLIKQAENQYNAREDLRVIVCATEAIGLDNTKIDAYYWRGMAYRRTWLQDDMLDDANKLLECASSTTALHLAYRGWAFNVKNEPKQAVTECSKALSQDETVKEAYYYRAWANYNLEEFERAIEDYDKAIKLDDKYASAYNGRGLSYKGKEDYERAIEDYNKAIELDPKNNLARNNRINAYHAKDEKLAMKLVDIRKNKQYMQELKDNIKKVIPFLGAGASKPYGYYTWGSLLEKLLELCCSYYKVPPEKKMQIQKYIDDGAYIDAASELDKIFSNISYTVCTMIEHTTETNPINIENMRSILSEYLYLFPHNLCLTTNYDTVAQEILNIYGNKSVESVYPSSDLKEPENLELLKQQMLRKSKEKYDKTIYYLHGTYNIPASITLSNLQYDDYYGADDNIRSNLRRSLPSKLYGIYHNSIFLYIGCGMAIKEDRILKVLREFCRSLPNSDPSYALLNVNEIANTEEPYENWESQSEEVQKELNRILDEKEYELADMNVRVIWYSAPKSSKDGHESAKRQLLKYILDDEKKRLERKNIEEVKKDTATKKLEFEKLQMDFNSETPKKNEINLSEDQLKHVSKFFQGEIHKIEGDLTKCEITFPMYKVEGERYEIYLVSENGEFFLSDEGATYKELDKIFELKEPDVIKNLVAILKQYGCFKRRDDSIIIHCTLEDIHIKMSHLIQAISFMLNMKIFYV